MPHRVRRELLDAAFKAADVRNLPGRPDGKHVVADLMAHYFRSSAANDLCYNARIGRNTYPRDPRHHRPAAAAEWRTGL